VLICIQYVFGCVVMLSGKEQYYQFYDNPGSAEKTDGYFTELLSALQLQIMHVLAEGDPLDMLVFGSATERNLRDMRLFMQEVRPDIHLEDTVVVLDIEDHPLKRHRDYVKEIGCKTIHMVKADINEVPLAAASADLLITDFSINFNLTVEGYKKTITSISRLLSDTGICVASICIHPEEEQSNKDLFIRETSVITSAIKQSLLFRLLEEAGLEYTVVEEITGYPWSPCIRLTLSKK